ncbi:hypothetical protein L1987_59538 [Smallanthus sonchifolius]|uniref:Uncharacterized protein n=1 Tax=Smallanthus sonchifolius TaxID=185202 RepID=A0ACB9D5Y8_9ASTR|nr:hypothetical protein L1987_59538 [Smallanthus sonchifolius]
MSRNLKIKRAREVYAQKVDLAYETTELLSRVSGVVNLGDGYLAAIDEMYKSLEKRLTLAVKQKEAAYKEKLQKEGALAYQLQKGALAYQRSQMEKLVEESKKLEQQAMKNLKRKDCECYMCHNILNGFKGRVVASSEDIRTNKIVKSSTNYPEFLLELAMDQSDKDIQMEKLVEESKRREQEAIDNLKEFLIDCGHVVNMSREEISYTYKDVNILKEDLQDYKDENGISVTEDYSIPIIQETIPRQYCECYKCHDTTVSRFIYGTTRKKQTDKEMKKRIEGQVTEAVGDHEDNPRFGFREAGGKIAPLVAEITEVGHSMSTEGSVASAQTYAKREAAPLTMKRDVRIGPPRKLINSRKNMLHKRFD